MIPHGYVDTHIHGCFGCDTSDADPLGIVKMSRALVNEGVTAFMPTTMTISFDDIRRCFEAVSEADHILKSSDEPYAEILGIHLEGPFLNPSRAGVQVDSLCVTPDKGVKFISQIEDEFPGLLKIIDIAPELNGGMDFIREYSDRYCISLAHTDAGYETACEAFECGAASVTHILNAMDGCEKRAPGVLGAVFDHPDVYTEIICDGIHIAPAVLRMLFKLLPEDRTIIVSDSMRGTGMPDGMYDLGSVSVEKKDGRTYFGTARGLAGSVTGVSEMASRLKTFGIAEEKIERSLYDNPLGRIGLR